MSCSRLKFSTCTCTCINDDVIKQYNPNPIHNHKKGIKSGALNPNPNPAALVRPKRRQIAAV